MTNMQQYEHPLFLFEIIENFKNIAEYTSRSRPTRSGQAGFESSRFYIYMPIHMKYAKYVIQVLYLACAWPLVARQVRWTCSHAIQTSHLLCSRPAMHSMPFCVNGDCACVDRKQILQQTCCESLGILARLSIRFQYGGQWTRNNIQDLCLFTTLVDD